MIKEIGKITIYVNNVEEAKKLGFVPFEGFPDIDKTYTSNVLEIFGHRLIKNERSDSKYFYDFWIDQNQILKF